MRLIIHFIENGHVAIAWGVMLAAFAVLAKSADAFVESSVAIAERMRIPKLVIGILLVSLATTAPELSVSMFSAIQGKPEMALGNAIGSVICNCGVALALCGVLSAKPIPIIPNVLITAGGFLLFTAVLMFVFVIPDRTLARWEGIVLLMLFCAYMSYTYRQHKTGKFRGDIDITPFEEDVRFSAWRLAGSFAVGLGGIIIASRFVVISAVTIARTFGISEAVIALTIVALGTSIPEVATSITAARKGQGELSVGNILGANIMNICWVAGASSVANSLTLQRRELYFMFPSMFVILAATLIVLRTSHRLSRREGLLLFGLYLAYLASFFLFFRHQSIVSPS